jgi:hypothetical protein
MSQFIGTTKFVVMTIVVMTIVVMTIVVLMMVVGSGYFLLRKSRQDHSLYAICNKK